MCQHFIQFSQLRQHYRFNLTDEEPEDPIQDYELGPFGRVQSLHARIQYHHLRQGPRNGRGYTDEVQEHIHSLDFCHGASGASDGDQVGHIIGDALVGPSNKKYNFFPQGRYCNANYYHEVEKKVIDFLKKEHEAGRRNAYVFVDFEFHYFAGSNRPKYFTVDWQFSDGAYDVLKEFHNI